MTRSWLGLVALCFAPSLALADTLLTGEDAAYIDWSVNNCGTKSTDKEHAMVDQANAKDKAGFLRKYMATDVGGALDTPNKQVAMCADIKAWYGPSGSRFVGLITWGSAAAASVPDRPAATAGKGRRRSGGGDTAAPKN